jgi:hypothetical protein
MDWQRLQQRFWLELSTRSLAIFLLAVFFTFSSLGFLLDILDLGRRSPAGLAALVLFSGGLAIAYGYVIVRRRLWLIPVVVVAQVLVSSFLPQWFPLRPAAPSLAHLEGRVAIDVIGTLAVVMLGYGLFMMLIVREGTRAVALRAELTLAREIHQSLVPAIDRRRADVEVCGVSHPSGDVGGDLVDFVEDPDGSWIGYVADVSGHGVSAGLMMTMVKSAARAELRRGADLPALLATLNRTVLDARKPNMFVTFAAVRCHTTGELEFTVAGHLPILHVPGQGESHHDLTLPQIPLGIVDDYAFASRRTQWVPGDLLALVTDGLSEVFDRADREFGLDRLSRFLEERRTCALPELRTDLLAAVRAHGPQIDDQTLLFLRRR